MRLVPFEVEHLLTLEADTTHNDDARPFLMEHPEAMAVVRDYSWSIEHEGRIVGCGGKVGGAEANTWAWWVTTTSEALRHPFALTRLLRRHLDRECATGTHFAHALDLTAERWLLALGFQPTDEEDHGAALFVREGVA